jgi:hypothetical protein
METHFLWSKLYGSVDGNLFFYTRALVVQGRRFLFFTKLILFFSRTKFFYFEIVKNNRRTYFSLDTLSFCDRNVTYFFFEPDTLYSKWYPFKRMLFLKSTLIFYLHKIIVVFAKLWFFHKITFFSSERYFLIFWKFWFFHKIVFFQKIIFYDTKLFFWIETCPINWNEYFFPLILLLESKLIFFYWNDSFSIQNHW